MKVFAINHLYVNIGVLLTTNEVIMTKKYLGTFGVDSGQVMLVDH